MPHSSNSTTKRTVQERLDAKHARLGTIQAPKWHSHPVRLRIRQPTGWIDEDDEDEDAHEQRANAFSSTTAAKR